MRRVPEFILFQAGVRRGLSIRTGEGAEGGQGQQDRKKGSTSVLDSEHLTAKYDTLLIIYFNFHA